MLRNLIGVLVVAHGLVTIAIWSPSPQTVKLAPPMDTSQSWLLGNSRIIALALAITAGLSVTVAGIAFLAQADWWPLAALIS